MPCAGLQHPPGSGAPADVQAPWASAGHSRPRSTQTDTGREQEVARTALDSTVCGVLEGAQHSCEMQAQGNETHIRWVQDPARLKSRLPHRNQHLLITQVSSRDMPSCRSRCAQGSPKYGVPPVYRLFLVSPSADAINETRSHFYHEHCAPVTQLSYTIVVLTS